MQIGIQRTFIYRYSIVHIYSHRQIIEVTEKHNAKALAKRVHTFC